MGAPFKPGQLVIHINKTTVGGADVVDTQVMGASEEQFVFARRVNEMATLCCAARSCRDSTAMTAIQTRINAIDD